MEKGCPIAIRKVANGVIVQPAFGNEEQAEISEDEIHVFEGKIYAYTSSSLMHFLSDHFEDKEE